MAASDPDLDIDEPRPAHAVAVRRRWAGDWVERRLRAAAPWSRATLAWLSSRHWRIVVSSGMVFVALSAIALAFVLLVDRQNDSRRRQALDLHAGEMAELIGAKVVSYVSMLEVLGATQVSASAAQPGTFLRAADAIRQRLPPVLAVNLMDADRYIRIVSPLEPNRAALNRRVGQSPEVVRLLDDAVASRQPRVTRPVTFFQGGEGIAVYIPMFDGDRLTGFVNAAFRVGDLARDILQEIGVQEFCIRLADGDRKLFASCPPSAADYSARRSIPIYNQTWTLTVQASRPLLDLAVPAIPTLLVVPIEVFAAVLTLSIYLLLRNLRRLRLTEAAVVAADRAKSAFLANMSHELRTPLNAVIGFGQMIEQRIGGPERAAGYAQRIILAGNHLLAVISDILDISKVEAGRLELHLGPVDIRAVIEASVGIVIGTAQERGVRVTTALPAGLPPVWADQVRLKQILLNLLSNAVKFTGRGGQVRIAVASHGDAVGITVEDTGIGMSPAEVALALQPFRQVGALTTRRYEGAGLGLPLAKRLVEMHGGTLAIDSEPGLGTRIAVTLAVGGPMAG